MVGLVGSPGEWFCQRDGAALGRIPSRHEDTGPCPESLPMRGHNFVPAAACFWLQFYAQPIVTGQTDTTNNKQNCTHERTTGVGRPGRIRSRSKDTGAFMSPACHPLPTYGHSFVPVAACFWPQFYAHPICHRSDTELTQQTTNKTGTH